MDKMLVCGTSAPGSIPGESTNNKGWLATLLQLTFEGVSELLS